MEKWTIIKLLFVLGYAETSWCLSTSSFSLITLCNFQDKFNAGCFKQVQNPRDSLECLVICAWTDKCTGAVTLASSCYFELACSFMLACSSSEQYLRYYRKLKTQATVASNQTTIAQITTTLHTPTTTETQTPLTGLTTLKPSTEKTPSSATTTSQPTCQNSGTPLTPFKCNCTETGGWVGDYCERLPHNCSEIARFGYISGTDLFQVDIYRNNSYLINTPCNVGSTRNEIGFLKNTGQNNYNKTWGEYVNGFYINSNNFWLGLNNIATYNSLGLNKVGVLLTFQSQTIKGTISQEYSGFRLSGNLSRYSYSVNYGGSSTRSVMGTGSIQGFELGDIFIAYNNTPFSTYDRDHDMEPTKNCAALTATGWWFKTCTPEAAVNPLGNFYTKHDEERVILPKYNTTAQGPREAFKHIYIFLSP